MGLGFACRFWVKVLGPGLVF